jgi:hypothetical protein
MGQLLGGVSGVSALDTVFGNPACNVTLTPLAASRAQTSSFRADVEGEVVGVGEERLAGRAQAVVCTSRPSLVSDLLKAHSSVYLS